jgi:hypothetical protein
LGDKLPKRSMAAPSLRSGHALSRGSCRATEPPSACLPIWVTVVAAGACGAGNALSQPSAGCGRRPSKLTARTKPVGRHWDRTGLTNSWPTDREPNSTSLAFLLCLARASVRSRLYGALHDGVRRGVGRPSSWHVLKRHRGRHGLTSPHVLGRAGHATRTCLRSDRGRGTAVLESRTTDPDPVHDDRQLPRHRHQGLFVADALGKLNAPHLEHRPLLANPQMGVGSLVEAVPQQLVAALADVARSIQFARLINARR